MGDRDERGPSGSTVAIVAVVGFLLLGLPCLLAVALFGAGMFFYYRAVENPLLPPIVQPAPPIQVKPQPAPPTQFVPVEETPAEQSEPVSDQK